MMKPFGRVVGIEFVSDSEKQAKEFQHIIRERVRLKNLPLNAGHVSVGLKELVN